MEWVHVRIPAEMMKEIKEIVKSKRLWVNEHEFIRDAIREKMRSISSGAVLNYIRTEKLPEEETVS